MASGPAEHRAGSEPPGLLDLLETGAQHGGTLTVLDRRRERRAAPFALLWERSEAVAGELDRRTAPGATVGAVLTTSLDCVVTLLAVLRGGRTLASLPARARAMSAEQHAGQLRRLVALTGAGAVVADGSATPALAALPVPVLDYEALQRSGASPPPGGPAGRLVQFTSGSTSHPKGIVLPLDRVGANVRAVIAGLRPGPGDSVCSWLPLSHDMGLIGALFVSWAAGADLLLIDPQLFVGDPSLWMRSCAEVSATHTWGPNFGYALAARTARRVGAGSLASLRVCLVGAEPVQASTLRAFAGAMAPLGLSELALTPGYGLAEATLGVSAQPLGERWRSVHVDALALGRGDWRPQAGGSEIVGAGRPLPGMRVRLAPGERAVAEIEVAGPSLLVDRIGGAVELRDGEWLRTGDLGTIVDGHLFVTGRRDDLLIVAGRNLYARDLELAAAEHPAVRAGNCVAAQRADGRYVIVAEHHRDAARRQMLDAGPWIRRELTMRFGAAPADVAIIAPGALPKTPSGKLARHRAAALYEQGTLPRLA